MNGTPKPRFSPIAAAVSTLLLGGSAPYALAQTAAATEPTQTVVVTGIRRGIESAVSIKRNSDSIVEAVSAEDIGKLPDVSIAESLARLPGVTAQRVGGRAQVISIRGLSPDFAVTLLNGREQVTTGDNRGVEYDQFPGELINSATVYKTPDAELPATGLSGTINMQSIRPLDFASRAIVLNARAETNSNGAVNANTSVNGTRFSASYVDQFADRTIGVALGFAHLDNPGQDLHYKAWGFSSTPISNCRADWGCSKPTGVPDGVTVLNGYEATAVSRKQTRDGLMGVLEYKPNKNLHSVVDLYYSKFTKDETMRGLMGGLAEGWGGKPGVAYSNVGTTQVGATTVVTSADLANANMVVRNDLNTRDDTLKAAGWNLKARLSDKWSGEVDLSYSKADRSENVIETYASAPTLGTFKFSTPTEAGFPSLVPGLNYADAATVKLSDPGGWGHDGLWKKPRMSDELKSLRLEARRDLDGFFSGVDFGLNYADRTKVREMNELAADLKNGRTPVLVPGDLLQGSTSLAHVGIPGVLAYDVMGALNRLYDLKPQAVDQIIARNYEIFEKVTTAYAKLGIDTTLGSLPLSGNLGLQLVHTDQSSHGYSKLKGVISEVSRGTTYDDVLPSVNLKLELSSSDVVRLGVAKTMARGRMDDMRAGADVSLSNQGKWSGNGGNPELEPWRAISYDLSYEKYLGKRSYVAAAGFYKDLQNYIYKQKIEMDFSGFPNTSTIVPQEPQVGLYETPENGQGGWVRGIELAGSFDFGQWYKGAEGWGVQANASFTKSNVEPDGPGKKVALPGLSGTVAALTVYYEANGFSARIGQRYRSAFRGEVTGLHNAREFPLIESDYQTDLQLGYEFQSGTFKGLSLLLQVFNATDSPYATRQGNGFTGDVVAPQEYNKYGRTYLFGVNYKM